MKKTTEKTCKSLREFMAFHAITGPDIHAAGGPNPASLNRTLRGRATLPSTRKKIAEAINRIFADRRKTSPAFDGPRQTPESIYLLLEGDREWAAEHGLIPEKKNPGERAE